MERNLVCMFEEDLNDISTTSFVKRIFYKFDSNGFDEMSFLKADVDEIEDNIIKLKMRGYASISKVITQLKKFAEWCYDKEIVDNDDEIMEVLSTLDSHRIWEKTKPLVKEKYLSQNEYKELINSVEIFEEHNALYYTTLIQALYEGLYNDELEVIKNLRKSDVDSEKGIVKYTDNEGNKKEIKVSIDLAERMCELAEVRKWNRRTGKGVASDYLVGNYNDSVFKIVTRQGKDMDGAYKFFYYKKIKKIIEEHSNKKMSPNQIYYSGIMARICDKLKENELEAMDVFRNRNRNCMAYNIIKDELNRCGCDLSVSAFKYAMRDYIELFE